jgi:tetratricopeptide (TPR) repeat protein
MQLALVLAAALAATAGSSIASGRILLAQAAEQPGVEPAPSASQGKIEHKPLERIARGAAIIIRARVKDPARLFAPLVFARPANSQRYSAYTMVDRAGRGFAARLPSSILEEGSFEYFIEARHDEGEPTRFGSPNKPIVCVAFDPPARPVKATFRTDEPGATLKVDDNDAGTTPVTVALGPGPHVIQVIAPDGRVTEQQLDVKPGRSINMTVPLPARTGGPASLGVTSDPQGARVFVDGSAAGVTPYSVELTPGAHAVAVELAGRLRQERQITARQGRDVQLAFFLPAMPKDPALTVESEPAGASVLIDGKERGRTPFIAPVSPGKHELVLRLAGRRDLATDFAMPAEKDLSLRLDLLRASGAPRLTVASVPDGATVLVDGTDVGLTPWNGEVKLGAHTVQVVRAGYLNSVRTVTMQSNRDADLSFALERIPGPGLLRVEAEPPDAEVSIDGQPARPAPFSGELTSGDHNVEVSSVGYRTVAQQITLVPGQQISLRIALSPAGGSNAPPIVGVNSAPEGALLFLDGKLIGPTPKKAPTTPGQHELRLVLDGYKVWSAPTRLPDKPGFELRVAVALKPVREAEAYEAPAALELARAQYKRADACYAAQNWACAASGYQAAYEYTHRPELLFNLAQSQRHMGNLKEALGSYQAFLREKRDPNPKIKSQAEQYIAFCQLAVQPGEIKAPGAALAQKADQKTAPAAGAPPSPGAGLPLPEPVPPLPAVAGAAPASSAAIPLPTIAEDTSPPTLTHEPVRKAVAGTGLRLAARIVDERSTVGDAQACWRNLLHIEYECIQLTFGADDEYFAMIPGTAVADGFAYYLEAYDSLGNGPAQSGTPKLPHSVAVDQADTLLRQAVAEAIKPVPAGGPVQAGFSQAGPAQFDLQRPAGTLITAQPAERAWKVAAYGGAESSSEGDTNPVIQSRFGIDATRALGARVLGTAHFDWRSAKQPYVPDPGANPNQRITFDEQRYDASAGIGYDVGAALGNGSFSLVPTLGVQYVGIRNGTFPFDLFGADFGLRAQFPLFGRLDGQAAAAFAHNFLSQDTNSALGTLRNHFSGRLGVVLPLGRFAMSLDYRNDILAFTHTDRVAHGATLGFGSSF